MQLHNTKIKMASKIFSQTVQRDNMVFTRSASKRRLMLSLFRLEGSKFTPLGKNCAKNQQNDQKFESNDYFTTKIWVWGW